jgi:hypothetical protein
MKCNKLPNLATIKLYLKNTISDPKKSMRKFLSFIPITLFFLVFPSKLDAQVNTGVGNFQMCYHANTAIPITVQNMIGVDSLRLVLNYNSEVIEYIEYFSVNSALAGGSFNISTENNSLIISWNSTSSASIFNDTLVWINFEGLVGSTDLTWQMAGSYFHTSSGNTPIIFTNGSVVVDSKINVLLTEINPTCSNQCDANYMANASGGLPPYSYRWNGKPGRFDSIQTNMCAAPYKITITDSKGCKLDSTFTINGLPGANVKLIIEGNEDTTIYLQNPVLTFSFQEISPTHVIEPPLWRFGDGDTAVSFNPTHLYSRANINTDGYYDLILEIKNENGCDTTIQVRIPIKEAKLKIPGVITPNGDSYNESFMILNENKIGSGEEIKITTEYQRMELVIFDRWGRKIYDDSNYQSDWNGDGVPDGSYYFILTTVGYYQTDKYKGSIVVLGSSVSN